MSRLCIFVLRTIVSYKMLDLIGAPILASTRPDSNHDLLDLIEGYLV